MTVIKSFATYEPTIILAKANFPPFKSTSCKHFPDVRDARTSTVDRHIPSTITAKMLIKQICGDVNIALIKLTREESLAGGVCTRLVSSMTSLHYVARSCSRKSSLKISSLRSRSFLLLSLIKNNSHRLAAFFSLFVQLSIGQHIRRLTGSEPFFWCRRVSLGVIGCSREKSFRCISG